MLTVSCRDASVPGNQRYVKQFSKIDDTLISSSRKLELLDSLNHSLQAVDNDSIFRAASFRIAKEYFYLNQGKKYLDLSRKLVQKSTEAGDALDLARSLYYVGDYYEDIAALDSAYLYYVKSFETYKLKKDTLNIGRLALYKAGILYDAGIFSEAEVENTTALRLLTASHNTRLTYESYNLMAITLKELGELDKSLDYFEKASKQIDALESENYPPEKIFRSRITFLNNIGGVYEKKADYAKAIDAYRKALATRGIEDRFPKLYASLKSNLAYSSMKLGITKNIERSLLESLSLRERLNSKSGIVSSKIALGEYYFLQNKVKEGLRYIKEAYKEAYAIKSNYDMLATLKLLSENDPENSEFYTRKYIALTEKIRDSERYTRNKFARISFETEQAEREVLLLSKEKTLLTVIAVVISTLLLLALLLLRLRSKNSKLNFMQKIQRDNEKINQLLANQNAEAEKARTAERERIAMELHDGIINRIFTTRFNLMQLDPEDSASRQLLVQELQDAENEIRQVSRDLVENLSVNDKSFEILLNNLVASQKNEFQTTFKLSIDKYIDWNSIPDVSKINVYRIIQECLQNVNKHSQANSCNVLLLRTDHQVTVRIHDDGIGFHTAAYKSGHGKKNIAARAALLNAVISTRSVLGKGTTVELIF